MSCGICSVHRDSEQLEALEIWRSERWLLRHHPLPAPLSGWCLLDSRRHLGGPADFWPEEAREWGLMVQRASLLVKQVSGCDRVYLIAFGEGARHLHLHLIPRFGSDPLTQAWCVADLYREVERGQRPGADPDLFRSWMTRAREVADALMAGTPNSVERL